MGSKSGKERKCAPVLIVESKLSKGTSQFLRLPGKISIPDPPKAPNTFLENGTLFDSSCFRKSYKDALLEKLPVSRDITPVAAKFDMNNNLVYPDQEQELEEETGEPVKYSCDTPVKKAAVVAKSFESREKPQLKVQSKKFPGYEMKGRKIVVEVPVDESDSEGSSDSDSDAEEDDAVVEVLDDELYFESASQCRANSQTKKKSNKLNLRFERELAKIGFKPKSEQLNDFLIQLPELRPGENLLESIGEPLELPPSETLSEIATKAKLKYQIDDVVVLKHDKNVEFKVTSIAPWKKWCYHVRHIGSTCEQSKWISEEEILKKSGASSGYKNRYITALTSKEPSLFSEMSFSNSEFPKPAALFSNGSLTPTKPRPPSRLESLGIAKIPRCSSNALDDKQTPPASRGFSNDSSEICSVKDVTNSKKN